MGGAQLGEGMYLVVPRCWNGSPDLVSLVLVDSQRGQTTLSASQVAAGPKRHKTVELGTPYKRPISDSGRLLVNMMIMMMLDWFNFPEHM
ncbi:jg5572 [Pararge aegeria aegeria]|uniref:Jg5572 protein n=1 Tax=Pararge aegeria aegeria TaxID=348720 RepID=A0A8S4QNU5_9NEOP|nr:jg5572 [Pararge aegeria aegeria]